MHQILGEGETSDGLRRVDRFAASSRLSRLADDGSDRAGNTARFHGRGCSLRGQRHRESLSASWYPSL